MIDGAPAILVGMAAIGVAGGSGWALLRRFRPKDGLSGRTALERGVSYAALALLLALATWAGVPGIAALIWLIGAIALLEWGHLMDLPVHHRIALEVAHLAIIGSVAVRGVAAVEWLIGGIVLVGIAWPVVRSDTGRAIRDLGAAAVGCVVISILLAHAVVLAVERGALGITLFAALAVACAGSDVGAYIVGRRFGRTPLAPGLSPNKTREGVVGNVLGAAIGLAPFIPLLRPSFEPQALLVLIALVAVGALWGDLLESAVKREVGVKDAARWLPGFGGILDRIDSLLLVIPLVYWAMRIADVAR
ncbi:MAG TPA: phosphatidate cytidylyltransferase [Candidatus Limnocylindrales bacterium]|nr:phosphatidate cytidylyltransferase [Candidatus Limnocylindrales bacterium]